MNNDKIPCCEISSEQSIEKECMTLCPFFVLLKKEDHALLPVSLPCCEPTTFYTIYYPFHSLAASQRCFTTVRDSENPCCQPTTFYAVYCPFHSLAAILYGFTLVCGLQAKRSSGKKEERETLPRSYTVLCRFIYPNLSVRLKKVHVFYTVFSLFRTEICGLFCVFPAVFFPPRQERTR
jgi:hypothetical protein